MRRRPPKTKRTDTRFPSTTLFRSHRAFAHREPGGKKGGEVEAPRAIELRRDPLRLRAIVEDMIEPRRHRAHAGVGADAFGEHRQMIGLPKIVGVEEGDPVATRRPERKSVV